MHEGCSDDSERPGLLRIAGGGEETARHLECSRHDSTRLVSASLSSAHAVVVGPGQSRDRVKDEKDILAALYQTLGAFDGEFRDTAMVLGRQIIRAGVDLRFGKLALELGDFLRPLVHQENHEVRRLGVQLANRLGEMEEKSSLARSRWGDNQTALASSNRRNQVDDSGRVTIGDSFECDAFDGIGGGQFFEVGEDAGFLCSFSIDRGDFDELRSARSFLCHPVDPGSHSQAITAHKFRREKNILARLFEILLGAA